MKIKNKRLLISIILITLIFSLIVPICSYAEENQKKDKEDKDTWLEKILSKTIGKSIEDAFDNASSLVNKWIFLTPKLVDFEWVKKLWWNNYIIAIFLSVIGAGITIMATVVGKRIATKSIVQAILVGFVCSTLSLYLTDTMIQGSNTVTNAMVRETLVTEYFREENKAALLEEDLDPDEVGFNSFTSKSLLKLAFGGDLTDEKTKMYQTFSSENDGAGSIVMVWAMLICWLIGIFGYIRYGVLALLGAGSPFWFSICSFTGDIKPALGYTNLYARSLALSYIFDCAWLFAVYINRASEFEGIGQQTLTCIIFTLALIAAVWIWVIWVILAIKQPFTLAGSKVQEHYGKLMGKTGMVLESVGGRYNIESLQEKGGEMQVTGAEHVKIAAEKTSNNYEDSTKDRLSQARERYKQDVLDKARREKVVEDYDVELAEDVVKTMYEVAALGISQIALEKILEKEGLSEAVTTTEDGKLLVNDNSVDAVNQVIKKNYEINYMKEFNFSGKEGVLIDRNIDHIEDVETTLEEERLDYNDLYNITINENELKGLKTLVYEFKPLAEKSIKHMPNGMLAIEENEDSGIEKMLELAGVEYDKVGNDIFFKESDYKQIENKIEKGKTFIEKYHLEEDTTFDYNTASLEQKEDIVRDIKTAGLEHQEKEMIWVDKDSKEVLLDSVTEMEKSREIDDTMDLACIQLSNKEFYNGLNEEIKKTMPYALVEGTKEDIKNNRLFVERKYIGGVKDIIKKYSAKLPYWTDSKGNFYYYDTSLKLYIKDVEPPKNGRYMGVYQS